MLRSIKRRKMSHYDSLGRSPPSPLQAAVAPHTKSHRLAVRGCCVRNAARARAVRWERHARSQSSHGQRRRLREKLLTQAPRRRKKKTSSSLSLSHGTVTLPLPCLRTATENHSCHKKAKYCRNFWKFFILKFEVEISLLKLRGKKISEKLQFCESVNI